MLKILVCTVLALFSASVTAAVLEKAPADMSSKQIPTRKFIITKPIPHGYEIEFMGFLWVNQTGVMCQLGGFADDFYVSIICLSFPNRMEDLRMLIKGTPVILQVN